MRLSAVIIARNEERMIEAAIASCAFADEVVVVDGGSTDATVSLAGRAGARVVERPFEDFARQRNFALSRASGEWALFVDADERVTPGLRDEIAALLAGKPEADGYEVPRRAMALGRWLGWHFGKIDAPLRLVRRAVASCAPAPVHERLEVSTGRTGRLRGELVHLTHRSIAELVDKINRYSDIEAEDLSRRGGAAPSRRAIVASFPRYFWRFWRSGLRREGMVGAVEAALLAFDRTLVLAKLWERAHADEIAGAYAAAEAALRPDPAGAPAASAAGARPGSAPREPAR